MTNFFGFFGGVFNNAKENLPCESAVLLWDFLAVGGIFKNILVFVELRKNVVHYAQKAR